MPFTRRRGGRQMMMGGEYGIPFLLDLGAVAIYNGTLTAEATPKAKNLGSAGSALDGTLTDVNIANGFVSNGTTSSIAIPTHASLTGLTEYTYVAIFTHNTLGEGSRVWNWANLAHAGGFLGGPAPGPHVMNFQIARAIAAALSSFSNFYASLPGAKTLSFTSWDGTDISSHAAKQGATALTSPSSQSNGSGAVTSLAGNILYLLNRALNDRTMDGTLHLFAVIPNVLTTDERLEVGRRFGIINPT